MSLHIPNPFLSRLALTHSALFLILWAFAANCAFAQSWTATPFNTPSIPLAVKGPYVNVWAPQGKGPLQVNAEWPSNWDFDHDIYGWYALVRIDGTAYSIMGNSTPTNAIANISTSTQTSVIVTPTRSSFLFEAGPIIVNATFLSPVEPDDPAKMSTPFSYFYVTFTSNDTNTSHDVQFYTDISGEWISGDDSLQMIWAGPSIAPFTVLQTALQTPGPFQEVKGTAQDGIAYYGIKNQQGLSWQIAESGGMRAIAANSSTLSNSLDPNFHAVGDPFEALGLMVNFGAVSTTTDPLVFAVGIVRDPVVQYTNSATQIENRSSYYWGSYGTTHDLIGAVFDNFTDALGAAQQLDLRLAGAGGAISGSYADLLALSTRQAFGGIDLTVARPASNAPVNMSDVKAFAKDFGNVGSGGVNAVDVLYAAMPAYIYLWPNLLRHLLSPLLEYQESSQYTNPYAAQDLGAAYPNATGDPNAHFRQIEQSANMLIMAVAHAQTTGDGSLLTRHYNLFKTWGSFLVQNALIPGSGEFTSSADSISAPNQTNLALKGIIGIGAMAKISEFVGQQGNASHYRDIAESYAQQWTSMSVVSNGIALSYGSKGSGVIYNLYADKLLQTNLIGDSIYDLQTSFYRSTLSENTYGFPLDENNPGIARTDWTMFAASVVTDTSVRGSLIDQIHAYASAGVGDLPFAVVYNPSDGSQLTSNSGGGTGGMNSIAQGAMFAPLALNVPIKSVSTSSGGASSSSSSKARIGAIVGGAIGVLLFLIAFILYRRRRRGYIQIESYNGRQTLWGMIVRWRKESVDRSIDIDPYEDTRIEPWVTNVLNETTAGMTQVVVEGVRNKNHPVQRPHGLPDLANMVSSIRGTDNSSHGVGASMRGPVDIPSIREESAPFLPGATSSPAPDPLTSPNRVAPLAIRASRHGEILAMQIAQPRQEITEMRNERPYSVDDINEDSETTITLPPSYKSHISGGDGRP